MKKIIVTGANGFIGRNLVVYLNTIENVEVVAITKEDEEGTVQWKLSNADIVFHLAGVNRTEDESEFENVNTGFTYKLVEILEASQKNYILLYASSTQAELNNPYGKSKLAAEKILRSAVKNGQVIIYRLPGVFGKWCRPNYNSVIATFCYNVANDLPISIRDEYFEFTIVYIDDVVQALLQVIDLPVKNGEVSYKTIDTKYKVSLGQLHRLITSFKQNRVTLFIPDMANGFEKALYSTYLSYLPENNFAYPLELKTDNRGSLFELLKTKHAGQIFISTTLPDVTRGNHFHHTKTEKFLVIQGKGLIKFRHLQTNEIIEYEVEGSKPTVVDIPPGYVHNITNTGKDIMITLFWANEVFDTQRTDTYFLSV